MIRAINRKIEVTEKNVPILLQHNVMHVFVFADEKKAIKQETPPTKEKAGKRTKKSDKA